MNYPAGSTRDTEEARKKLIAEHEAAQQAKRDEDAREAERAALWQAEEDTRLAAEAAEAEREFQ